MKVKQLLAKLNAGYRRAAICSLALVATAVTCFAQTTEPPTIDWAQSTQTVTNTLQAQIVAMFPVLLGLFGIIAGIVLFKMFFKKFAK